jgi:hypothetical protein
MMWAVELVANVFKALEAMAKLWALIPWRVRKSLCNSGKFKENLDLFTNDLQCINRHP